MGRGEHWPAGKRTIALLPGRLHAPLLGFTGVGDRAGKGVSPGLRNHFTANLCWGARGSIPVSGQEYLKYGADTTCPEIRTHAVEISQRETPYGLKGGDSR